MELDVSRSLAFFEGVKHAPEDIKKKWQDATIIAFDSSMPHKGSQCCYLRQFDDKILAYENLESGDVYVSTPANFYIVQEFPRMGVFQSLHRVGLLSRNDARQWRRGANPNTVVVDWLFDRNQFERSLAFVFKDAYEFKPIPFEVALERVGEDKPIAITHKLWFVGNPKSMMNLFYEDVFIGLVSKDREYIPHSETYTLAEEAIYDLQLRQL